MDTPILPTPEWSASGNQPKAAARQANLPNPYLPSKRLRPQRADSATAARNARQCPTRTWASSPRSHARIAFSARVDLLPSRPSSTSPTHSVAVWAFRMGVSDAVASASPKFALGGAVCQTRHSIYCTSDRSGEYQIWKVPFAGGTARQVTRNGGFEAVEDRDGRAVYYVKRGEEGIWTVPVAGGDESLVLSQGDEGDWTLGARGVYLLSKGSVSAIEYFDFAKRTVSRLRTLPALNLIAVGGAAREFAVSPDEQRFLYTAVERNEQDLMLLENFH